MNAAVILYDGTFTSFFSLLQLLKKKTTETQNHGAGGKGKRFNVAGMKIQFFLFLKSHTLKSLITLKLLRMADYQTQ